MGQRIVVQLAIEEKRTLVSVRVPAESASAARPAALHRRNNPMRLGTSITTITAKSASHAAGDVLLRSTQRPGERDKQLVVKVK